MSCGVEQQVVLPSVALLGLCAWGLGYRFSQSTLGSTRERERRKRRAGETLGLAQDPRIEPKAIGHVTERNVVEKEKAEESSHLAMRAIHEDRVLLLDRDTYLQSRSHLRILGAAMLGLTVAALAQCGAGDLIFSTLRLLFLLLLCLDFALTLPGHVAFQLSESPCLRKLPLGGSLTARQEGPELLLTSLQSSGARGVPFERLRLGALQLWAVSLLIWFEVFRHPKLRESACAGEDLPLLLAERSAALSMTLAWICGILVRLMAWRCEACVWLAPRAEELLAEFVESDGGGTPLHGAAVALAEGLLDPTTSQRWLWELEQLSVLVIDGSSQLTVVSMPSYKEILDLQREMHAELRRFSSVKETPTVRPRQSEDVKVSIKTPMRSEGHRRDELLKTPLDFARGGEAEGKPSDSGDSSSASPRRSSVADLQRVALDLQGVGLAQLLEEAMGPPNPQSEAAKLKATYASEAKLLRQIFIGFILHDALAHVGRLAQGYVPRAASQGPERVTREGSTGARRPKRYSEMRKMSLEKANSRLSDTSEAHWTTSTALPTVAPAPPSPPWNVQSLSSPLTTLEASHA